MNPDDSRSDFDIKGSKKDLILSAKCDIRKKNSFSGISGKTGEGVSEMLERIYQVYKEEQKQAIINTLECLKSVKKEISRKTARIEIVAEELRSSITEMDVLTGRIDVEQVLDNIFLNFCIGK